jgi:hypothetical protein
LRPKPRRYLLRQVAEESRAALAAAALAAILLRGDVNHVDADVLAEHFSREGLSSLRAERLAFRGGVDAGQANFVLDLLSVENCQRIAIGDRNDAAGQGAMRLRLRGDGKARDSARGRQREAIASTVLAKNHPRRPPGQSAQRSILANEAALSVCCRKSTREHGQSSDFDGPNRLRALYR